jgi:chromosomal replication initiation ATPase DnaA
METLIYNKPINYITAPATKQPVRETPDTVLEFICQEFNVTKLELRSKCRKRHLVDARALYFKYMVDTLNNTLVATGKKMNRDHTTVLHAKNDIFGVCMKDDLFYYKTKALYAHFGRSLPPIKRKRLC